MTYEKREHEGPPDLDEAELVKDLEIKDAEDADAFKARAAQPRTAVQSTDPVQ